MCSRADWTRPELLKRIARSETDPKITRVIGYTAGTNMQVCAYLTTRYGGMRNYGKIFGMIASLMALAGGLGPLLAFIHDR